MPDFDTRKPQEPNEPSRLRIALIASKLRTLLITTKPRIPLIAHRLRSLLIANKLRTLLIGGVILLFVGVVVTVGLPIYSSSGIGNWQHDSQIVFTLDGDVWTMKEDGSDMKRLTDTAAREEAPVWSPDGERIAFTRMVYEYGNGRASATSSAESKAGPSEVPYLFVMNADGSDQDQLLDSHAGDPAWSPDGQKIAFSAIDQNGWSDIYVTDADGSGMPRKLTTEPGEERFPAWSPDGEYIAFESERLDGRQLNNYVDVYVMKACCVEGDTNQPQRLTDNPGWNRYPEWSPDGTEIAFTYIDFGSAQSYGNSVIRNTDVHKIDADGSETRLTHTDAERLPEHIAAWSPSGGRIAYVKGYYELTHSPSSSAIYVMEADGSNPTLVKEFPERVAGYPDWFGTAQPAIADEGAEKNSVDWQALGAARQDAVFRSYFEQMNELLRWKDLRAWDEGKQARKLAQQKTLQVLGVSDPSQKRKVMQFLVEADAVQSPDKTAPFISLWDADLEGADLSDLNLSGAELDEAKLMGANLSGTDFSNANLAGADLTGANLSEAILSGAYLGGSHLQGAELMGADLSGADLNGAQLNGANLSGANLTNASLGADLTDADLGGANLTGADLKQVTLKNTDITLPDEYKSRVRAWEFAARSQLRNLTAAVNLCFAKYDPDLDQGTKLGHCTTSYEEYGGRPRVNITYQMFPQLETGEVLIKVEHNYGGSAFQSNTAASGRIERIPRF